MTAIEAMLTEQLAATTKKYDLMFTAVSRIEIASTHEEAKSIAAAALAKVIPEFFEADKPIELGVAV